PLESSPLVNPIKKLLEKKPDWHVLMQELLDALIPLASENELRSRTWPMASSRLSSDLGRLPPSLKTINILVRTKRRSDGMHVWLWDSSKAIDPFGVADGVGENGDGGNGGVDVATSVATSPATTRDASKNVAGVAKTRLFSLEQNEIKEKRDEN